MYIFERQLYLNIHQEEKYFADSLQHTCIHNTYMLIYKAFYEVKKSKLDSV